MIYRRETFPSGRSVPSPARRASIWFGAALLLLAAGAIAVMALRFAPHADARLVSPRIHGAGGVLPVAQGAEQPSAAAIHRLYVDVDDDAPLHGKVNKRLDTAAKILNLYAMARVPADKVRMVILFYGRGVKLALSDAAYRKEFGHANPNADLLTQLQHANVKMIVCGQALGHQSFTAADIAPGVTLALSALTKREELQAAGYGPVPKEAP
jgi:intracellular sulfur oxidation DsrE/DsrF family protein